MAKPKAQTTTAPAKVAFIFDDRLAHDRKQIFSRTATVLKSRFSMDILPSQITEDEVITLAEKNKYGLILLPWYKYIAWKKLENFFGALRLQGPTVAGYFADAVLPFEFSNVTNYHRFLFLDFYRLEQTEIEMMVAGLVFADRRSGFTALLPKHATVYFADWYDNDSQSSRCIDTALNTPVLQSTNWASRHTELRFYFTALWSLCFQEKQSFPDSSPLAHLSISEVNHRLMIKLVFKSNELTLKQMMADLWPSGLRQNSSVNELVRHSDFLRVHHFPETHHIEVLAFFSPNAPSMRHPGEVRGFWIEPLNKRFLKLPETETHLKRAPIKDAQLEKMGQSLEAIIETFRQMLLQSHVVRTPEERASIEAQLANIRFLLHEVEKRLPEKQKIA